MYRAGIYYRDAQGGVVINWKYECMKPPKLKQKKIKTCFVNEKIIWSIFPHNHPKSFWAIMAFITTEKLIKWKENTIGLPILQLKFGPNKGHGERKYILSVRAKYIKNIAFESSGLLGWANISPILVTASTTFVHFWMTSHASHVL